MTYTLTISSQGQVVIPSKARQLLGLKPGDKLSAIISQSASGPEIRLIPGSVDWIRRLAGTASGFYGNVDKYIEHERASWNKSKPWP